MTATTSDVLQFESAGRSLASRLRRKARRAEAAAALYARSEPETASMDAFDAFMALDTGRDRSREWLLS